MEIFRIKQCAALRRIEVFGLKGYKLKWRKRGEARVGGVILSGFISVALTTYIFLETTMNRQIYLDILKRNMWSSAETLGLHNGYYFQYDNDPKHDAEILRLGLLTHTVIKNVMFKEWSDITTQ